MVRTTTKRPPMSPDPFLACVMGSGNETTWCGVFIGLHGTCTFILPDIASSQPTRIITERILNHH